MPEGSTVTEANAAQMGCQWQSGEGVLSQMFSRSGLPTSS